MSVIVKVYTDGKLVSFPDAVMLRARLLGIIEPEYVLRYRNDDREVKERTFRKLVKSLTDDDVIVYAFADEVIDEPYDNP